jgi:hypothetical protein
MRVGDSTDPAVRHLDALLEALLAARPTVANDRFDAEVAAAIASGHLDATTARALRYRQRASVRAVETYLQLTLASIGQAREAADRAASEDVEADDLAWRQAQQIGEQTAQVARRAPIPEPTTPAEPAEPAEPAGSTEPAASTERAASAEPAAPERRRTAAAHLAVVPDYVPPADGSLTEDPADVSLTEPPEPAPARPDRTADETRQAIRAALLDSSTGR